MPWYVYLARCGDGTLYCGITTDVDRRIAQHNAGKGAKYTRGRGPVIIAARSGPLPNRGAAQRLEHEVKRMPTYRKIAFLQGASLPIIRKKTMKVAYVCGPYRSATHNGTHLNIQRARETAEHLLSGGFAVICPHTNTAFMGGVAPESRIIEGYVEILRRCDLLVLVRGFQEASLSEGMRIEIDEAKRRGIPVCKIQATGEVYDTATKEAVNA